MRHRLNLLNLILIVVLIFSFTACAISKTVAETTAQPAIEKGSIILATTQARFIIYFKNIIIIF